MEITYDDLKSGNFQIEAYPNFFVNSSCVFIEYNDLIRLPHFILLSLLRESENAKNLFTFNKLKYLSNDELLKIYIERKYRNIYQNFYKGDRNTVDLDKLDKMVEDQISSNNVFYDVVLRLAIPRAISILISSKACRKICIYHPYNNPFIENDIKETFGEKNCEFVYGELSEVLKDIPEDTTYMFSDIMKLNTLLEEDKLDLTTVLVAGEYKYNQDENGQPLLNLEKITNEHTFHFSFFSIFE